MKQIIRNTLLLGMLTTVNALALEVPTAPINAGAYDFTADSARLSFKDTSESEQGFRVYYNENLLGEVGAKAGSESYQYITLEGLTAEHLYTVKIVAYNEAGESEGLIKSFRTTQAYPPPNEGAPNQPFRYVGVWEASENSVRVSFRDNSDNEQGFRIKDTQGNLLKDNIPAKEGIGGYQYVSLSGLESGRLYQIQVVAYNEHGESLPSGIASFRTQSSTVTTPTTGCDLSTAITRDELRDMIVHGEDVTGVNTCAITDMSQLFYLYSYSGLSAQEQENVQGFNQDISGWDVSAVTDMSLMFAMTTGFNQDIGDWNLSSVTNTYGMFALAQLFNQDISHWDTSAVTNMGIMFYLASAFKGQDLSGWNVNNVTNHDQFSYGWGGSIEPLWVDEMHYWIENYNDLENTATVHFTMLTWSPNDVLLVNDQEMALDSGTVTDGYITLPNGRYSFKACDPQDLNSCSEAVWVDVAKSFDTSDYTRISILEASNGLSNNGSELIYGTQSGKIYALDLATAGSTELYDVGEKVSGLVYVDFDNYYYSSIVSHKINHIDMRNNTTELFADLFFPDGLDLYKGKLYSVSEDQSGLLSIFDLNGTQVGTLDTHINDMVGIGHTDNFLYILSEDGHIYQVDSTTGVSAKVFNNDQMFSGGNSSMGLEGMTILNNTIYVSYIDDSAIYKIDVDLSPYE